jgi:hypothetical protein
LTNAHEKAGVGDWLIKSTVNQNKFLKFVKLGNFIFGAKETRHQTFNRSVLSTGDSKFNKLLFEIMSSPASTQAVASIASYCLANMAMTVTNKYVFSVFYPLLTARVEFLEFCTDVVASRAPSSIFTVINSGLCADIRL